MYSFLQSFKVRFSLLVVFLMVLLALIFAPQKNKGGFLKSETYKQEAVKQSFEKPGLKSVAREKYIIDELDIIVPTNQSDTTEDMRLTERAARDLIYTYINSKEKGEAQKDLKDKIEKEAKRILDIEFTKYDKTDLKIKRGLSAREYKIAMQKALLPLTKIKEYELDTIAKYIKEEDHETHLATLKEDMKLYEKTIFNLLSMEVDKKVATPHLALVNAYSKLLAALQTIEQSRTKNDIILVYPGLKAFLEADAEIYSAFDALKLYVETEQK